jgi:hypothetical protein
VKLVIRGIFLGLIMWAIAIPVFAEEPPSFTFNGTVKKGEIYTHAMPQGLYFQLIPDEGGWHVEIHTTPITTPENDDPSNTDFASITPPLHGLRDIDIMGSDFRTLDNTGPNKGDNNRPQNDRKFEFALSAKDEKNIWHMYDCLTPDQTERTECKDVVDGLTAREGSGTLHITNYELSAPKLGEQAWFQSMSFTVSGNYQTPHEE